MGAGIFSEEKKTKTLYNDGCYFEKTKYIGYDFNISNSLDKVWTSLGGPEFMKENLSA